jgi:hypothetical protein
MQRLPDEVDAFMMDELRRGIPRAMILKHIRDFHVTCFMDENDIYDPDLALQMFSESPTSRGAWATMQDVYNRQTKLDRSTWKRHPNPLRSLLLWYYDETAPVTKLMFEIEAQGESACNGGNPDGNLADCPEFNLAFSFSSCIEIALKWANGQPIMMDSTHGTNNLGCTMTTLLAVDGHGNGQPIAWFFTKHETAINLTKFLKAFNMEVGPRISCLVVFLVASLQ